LLGLTNPILLSPLSNSPQIIFQAAVTGPLLLLYPSQVQLRNETEGLWRVFLELQDWEAALSMCASPTQRDVVHTAKADAAFAAHDYATAAMHYAKVRECMTR
jgi:hypothetical protein